MTAKQKESLFIGRDKYKDCETLLDVFRLVDSRDRDKYDIGHITPPNALSNYACQINMYVNLKEHVIKELSDFVRGFGLFKYKRTYFWGSPGCGCNNPYKIEYSDSINNSWLPKMKPHPIQEINPPEGRVKLMMTDRMSQCPAMDENFIYTPYRVCDRFMKHNSGGGCSAPIDVGYKLHVLPDGFNKEDKESIIKFPLSNKYRYF